MLLRTLRALDSTDLGLNPHHVLSVNTEVYTRHYTATGGVQFYSKLLGRVRSLPGVKSAALASDSPLTTMHLWKQVEKPGRKGRKRGRQLRMTMFRRVILGRLAFPCFVAVIFDPTMV